MSYALRSARFLAADVLKSAVREGDTVMIIGHNEDLALLQRS